MHGEVTELQVHFWMVLVMFALAFQAFILLLLVNAPYGRFARVELVSVFEITFDITEPVLYEVTGSLVDFFSAFSLRSETSSIAFLSGDGDIDLSGRLEPGRYRVFARAGAQTNGSFSSVDRTASFDFSFNVTAVPGVAAWVGLVPLALTRRRRRGNRAC